MKSTKGKSKAGASRAAAGGFGSGASGFGGFGGFGGSGSNSSLSYLAEPPSFTAISDPHVVVAFKNVLKKDSTTKAKALEELVAYAQAHPFEKDGGVEEVILDVWVQLYPRTSIDNSHRVRELSHNLQFELMKSARKRMERHIPSIVGAWLAGIYDRDRGVARAANDGLASFLNTPEKTLGFWKKCQAQILDYAVEAIQETKDTLSDERSTTKEDAEAKYFRVITASLSLMLGLLQRMDDSDIAKLQSRYDDYFAEETVWKSITFGEPSVRRITCQLLFACLQRKLPYAEDTKARQAFVTGGLRTSQAGSAREYVRALTKLTQAHPEIWSGAGEKKSSFSRLLTFIAKGSQGSPPVFWENLDQLLGLIPAELLNLQAASSLVTSLKTGVTNREEPRTNTSFAWKCYIDTASRLLKSLSPEDQLEFGKEHLFPLFEQFLFAVSDRSAFIPMGPNAISIFVQAYLALVTAAEPVKSAFAEEWENLSATFSANISGSLPEVSKEFQQSQEKIGEEGRRWFGLVGQIYQKIVATDQEVPDFTTAASAKVISQSISLLESRNLKPFGAASIIEFALSTSPHLFGGDKWTKVADFLRATAEADINKAITSPSSRNIFSCVRVLGTFTSKESEYAQLWTTWIDAVLSSATVESKGPAVTALISHEKGSRLSAAHSGLQEYILAQTMLSIRSQSSTWDLLEAAVTYQALSEDSYLTLSQDVMSSFEKEPQNSANALMALEVLIKGEPRLFSENEELHTSLVAHLLSMSELSDQTLSSKTASIRALLDSHTDGKLPVVGIIQSNLDRAGAQSLDIETVAEQARNTVDVPLEDIVPNTNIWMEQLSIFLQQPIDPTLSITSNVGGATALVRSKDDGPLPVQRDRQGRSIPVRMALYLNKVLESHVQLTELPEQFKVELLYLYDLTAQMVSDQITTMRDEGPWKTLRHRESLLAAEDLLSSIRSSMNSLISSQGQLLQQLLDLTIQRSQELTPLGLYSSRVLFELVQATTETQGLSNELGDKLLKTEVLKASPSTILIAAATISGLGEFAQDSKAVNIFCNRLVSDIAGASAQDDKTLQSLVLLSLCGQVYEKGELPVANNRVVFAVRQIASWLENPDELSPAFCAEVCRSLNQLLPCMKDVYGPYWERTLEFCVLQWEKSANLPLGEALPVIHASLKLAKCLESLPEPNDDLEDALKDFADKKPKALLELLKLDREKSSQPLEIVDGLICREVEKLPMRHIPDHGELFPLIASDSIEIQTAAFTLLHKAIPAQQEQNSVDVLLDKTDARLPDELLSLLLDAPTLEKYSDEALARFPVSIRSYLLAWKLVFDAYSTSSFKVRNDFTEHLKADGCLAPLLEFMFDVLGHSAAHALKLDKAKLGSEQIKDYDIKLAASETEEKSMQWLLVHLFYLTLKYIPGLFRSWYIDCRSKQTRIAVEAWTTKFFSPLIVEDTLEEVQNWADTQEPPAMDEQELSVKVSKPAREVTAGYEVDEDQAAIVIKVPSNYPIEGVTVSGLRRVAVTERKWQSWIMTTQGVITFSNGNIIDGLQVFKRNIVGALKGQGECAICYSIISTDKRMPDKRCTTCKNLFHRTCLYKWFQSSNQNTCPLCRNPIDYLGADTQKRRQG